MPRISQGARHRLWLVISTLIQTRPMSGYINQFYKDLLKEATQMLRPDLLSFSTSVLMTVTPSSRGQVLKTPQPATTVCPDAMLAFSASEPQHDPQHFAFITWPEENFIGRGTFHRSTGS